MRHNKKGQGLVEYAVLVAIVAAIVVAAAGPLKNAINTAFERAASTVNNAK